MLFVLQLQTVAGEGRRDGVLETSKLLFRQGRVRHEQDKLESGSQQGHGRESPLRGGLEGEISDGPDEMAGAPEQEPDSCDATRELLQVVMVELGRVDVVGLLERRDMVRWHVKVERRLLLLPALVVAEDVGVETECHDGRLVGGLEAHAQFVSGIFFVGVVIAFIIVMVSFLMSIHLECDDDTCRLLAERLPRSYSATIVSGQHG